jgi:hypothetical protein
MAVSDGVRLNKEQLLDRYDNPEWRRKFVAVGHLVEFLENCILKRDYKIPDHLNSVIKLSAFGQRVQQTLTTKHDVNAKEARLLCLLATAHTLPLIDIDEVDVEALAKSIDAQIKQRQLMFPNSYGRELYDKAAHLSEDETPVVSYADTLSLLDGTSVGYSQLGNYMVGPFGLITSLEERWVPPSVRVPLYHCSDPTCDVVHSALLLTDTVNPINEKRHVISSVLRQISDRPSDWNQFTAECLSMETRRFDDRAQSSIIYLLGDAFTLEELRLIAGRLTNGSREEEELKAHLQQYGIQPPDSDGSSDYSAAECLQMIMAAKDGLIVDAIDELVRAERIVVPRNERRRPVVNRGYTTGRYGLSPQLSEYGIRFTARAESVALLRLRRLVKSLYLFDNQSDVAELEWQLRGTASLGLDDKLNEFLQVTSPEEVLRRLVLGRRTNMVAACVELSVDPAAYATDDEFVQMLLWKLGFQLDVVSDANSSFWSAHASMQRMIQAATASAVINEQEIRSTASNYFVELEGLISDALAYSTWALTTDHIASQTPFTFRQALDAPVALQRLNNFAATQAKKWQKTLIYGEGRQNLYALCRGFFVLAELLEESTKNPQPRPAAELPDSAKYGKLQRFPFLHQSVFLDLLPSARGELLRVLREASDRLGNAKVNEVRNSWLHFQRSTTAVEPLVACLNEIHSVVSSLENAGLARVLFTHAGSSSDRWSKRVHMLRDNRGREISIETPSAYDWSRMPALREPQYLMTSARIGGPGEFLRFGYQVASPFATLWSNYPTRRRPGKTASDLPAASASAGTS